MKQDWKKVRLGEVCTIICGKDYKQVYDENGQYPIYGSGGIMGYASEYRCPENCTIVGRKGSINNPLFVETKFWNVDTAFALKADETVLNPKYLYYFCKQFDFNRLNVAVTLPSLRRTDVLEIEIPLPPLATQTRIVHQLDLLTRLTTLKAQQLTHLHHLAHSTFHHLFGDPVENEKGWPVKPLIETVNEGCPISYGIVQPFEDPEGVPVVRPVDLTDTIIYNKGLKCTRKDIADGYKRTQLEGGEILLCVRGTTGLVSFADSSLKGCNVSRGITPLAFGEKVDPWFMYGQMKTPAFQQAIADITYGIALKGVSMATLRQVKVIVPPIQLQKTFAQQITRLHRLATTIQTTQTHLHHLLQTTLHHHFG